MEFLKANGIEDSSFVKEMDYQEVLNSQEIFGNELEMFAKKEKQKEVNFRFFFDFLHTHLLQFTVTFWKHYHPLQCCNILKAKSTSICLAAYYLCKKQLM